eukprot:7159871-Prymnesium_polylepis.1
MMMIFFPQTTMTRHAVRHLRFTTALAGARHATHPPASARSSRLMYPVASAHSRAPCRSPWLLRARYPANPPTTHRSTPCTHAVAPPATAPTQFVARPASKPSVSE